MIPDLGTLDLGLWTLDFNYSLFSNHSLCEKNKNENDYAARPWDLGTLGPKKLFPNP